MDSPTQANHQTKTMPSRRMPSFFKVLIGDFSSEMRIPPAFVKNLKGLMHQRVEIVSHAARSSWIVKLEKDKDGQFFREGWREFVQENALQLGDFLVFKFDRKRKLYVRIYGLSACEKEVPPSVRQKHGKLPSREEPRRKESPTEIKRELTPPLEEELVQCLDKDGVIHPCFQIVLTKRHLQNKYLVVPSWFVWDRPQTVRLQVGERTWQVTLYVHPNHSRFSQGWVAFQKDNNLKVGDVCFFELIRGGGHSGIQIKVSIHSNLD